MNYSSRCAACKHLRRRCPSDCIFSPYFPSNNSRRFVYVHKIFGASNVGKLLKDLPVNLRAEAADSLYYEAYCRIKDPVYGCAGMITILHQQIYNAQIELARVQLEISQLQSTEAVVLDQYQQQQHVESTTRSGTNNMLMPQQRENIGPTLMQEQNDDVLNNDFSSWFL